MPNITTNHAITYTNMELLISEIVARNLSRDYRFVNDVVQKAFTVLIRGNILRKT